MKKCLIINGSARPDGDTRFFIQQFEKYYKNEIEIVDAFPIKNKKGISSCIDCRMCCKKMLCAINDDFQKILKDDYDLVIIASPIYMSNLPGPMINIINRFNFVFNNKLHLKATKEFKNKNACLVLMGGGGACKMLQGCSNEDLPIKQSKYIFNKLNANLDQNDLVLCLDNNENDIRYDSEFLDRVQKIAKKYN